mmetsp:Transcript_6448/g.13611  ORF Transcript_6448/g.13611 Transcript_6448/m.13611 type:complete len:208 (+) Transcript_6448:774-1397(+)
MQNTVASSTESPPTPSPSATTSSPSISSGAGASYAGSLGLLRRRRPPWQLVAAAPLPRQRQSVSPATRYAQLRLRHCDGVTCPATGIHAYRVQGTGDGSRTSSRTGRPRRFPRIPSASARSNFGWPFLGFGTRRILPCDVVRKSSCGSGDGSFLRWNDRMDQVLVIDGDWTLEVVDDPHGIALQAPLARSKLKGSDATDGSKPPEKP